MSENQTSNKRLAKNTIVLYFRMGFIILINLYMSRLILDTLGVEDYGIYNVVGGFVAMFSILSSSLSNAISRFITFELGKGNINKLRIVFSTSVNVQIILSIIIAILLETIGLWFLSNKMQIPDARYDAAFVVLQCSVLTFIINLISVPYNSSIIAHEHMTAFAYISILDVLLKLASVCILYIGFRDNLIVYAISIALSALFVRFVYGYYCKRKFEECKYSFILDRKLLKSMFSMASWNMLGSGAGVLNYQGTNVLMNMFFGVTVNAARGIASQVNAAVQQFAGSFITALNPQITKLYAKGDILNMQVLLHRGIKYSYYLMYVLALPIIIEAPKILEIWLKTVPEYTVIFVRLTIIIALITASGNILFTTIMATGDIKKYQLTIGCFSLSIFCLTTLFFYFGFPPYIAYIIHICIDFVILGARLLIINSKVNINLKVICLQIIPKLLLVSVVAALLPVSIKFIINFTFSLYVVFPIAIISAILTIYYIGLESYERTFIFSYLKSKIK